MNSELNPHLRSESYYPVLQEMQHPAIDLETDNNLDDNDATTAELLNARQIVSTRLNYLEEKLASIQALLANKQAELDELNRHKKEMLDAGKMRRLNPEDKLFAGDNLGYIEYLQTQQAAMLCNNEARVLHDRVLQLTVAIGYTKMSLIKIEEDIAKQNSEQ